MARRIITIECYECGASKQTPGILIKRVGGIYKCSDCLEIDEGADFASIESGVQKLMQLERTTGGPQYDPIAINNKD